MTPSPRAARDSNAEPSAAPPPPPDRCFVPDGRALWSLHENARVIVGGTQNATVVTIVTKWSSGWDRVELVDPEPSVVEVLRRMSLGPVSLENVPGLEDSYRSWRNRADPGVEWLRIEAVFDQLGGSVVAALGLRSVGSPVLTVVASSREAAVRLRTLPAAQRFRAREEATLRESPAEWLLECPGAPFRAKLHRRSAWLVARTLRERPASIDQLSAALDVPHPLVGDIFAYLNGAQLLSVDGD